MSSEEQINERGIMFSDDQMNKMGDAEGLHWQYTVRNRGNKDCKVLGIIWNRNEDSFKFSVKFRFSSSKESKRIIDVDGNNENKLFYHTKYI